MHTVLLRLFFAISFICISSFTFSQSFNIGRPEHFKIESLDGKKLILSFSIKMDNPTNKKIGVTVKKGTVYKNEELFGKFKLLNKIKLGKRANASIPIRIQVDMDKEFNLMDNLNAILRKPIELKLSGKLKGTWLIFWKKYPFEIKEKISVNDFLR